MLTFLVGLVVGAAGMGYYVKFGKDRIIAELKKAKYDVEAELDLLKKKYLK